MWFCTVPYFALFGYVSLYNTTFGLLIYRSWNSVLQKVHENKQSEIYKKKCRKSNKTQRKDFIVAVYCCFVCVFCVVFVSVCLSGGIQESKQTYGTNKKSSNFYSVTI